MNDLISRQAAIDELIRKMRPHNNGDGTTTICVMSEGLIMETLNNLPSAQPERKTGRWKDGHRRSYSGTYWFIYCSECMYERDDDNHDKDTPYCPNCGAKMED